MLGALFMVIASFLFTLMQGVVKMAGTELGQFQLVFLRGVFGLLFTLSYLGWAGINPLGSRENRSKLLLRGLFGGAAMTLFFWSLPLISLSNASALHHTHPLFTTVLAIPLLKEKVGWRRIVLVVLALFGALLIIRPDRGAISLKAVPAFLSAFLASLAYIMVRHLSAREHPMVIVAWLSVMSALFGGVGMIFDWHPLTVNSVGLVAGGAFLATVAQGFMTLAYKLEEASFVAVFSFSSILFAVILGKWIFGELPTVSEGLGIALLFFSMVALVWLRHREEKARKANAVTLNA